MRRAAAFLPSLTAFACMLWVPWQGELHVGHACAWTWVVTAALLGWGSAAHRVATRHAPLPADAGLRLGFGIAVTVAVLGALVPVGLVSRLVVEAWIAAGIGLSIWHASATEIDLRPAHPLAWLVVPVAMHAALYVPFSMYRDWLNPHDDLTAYALFPLRILDGVGLHEPFNLRRMQAFGAQSILQALLLARLDVQKAAALDMGVCVVWGAVLWLAPAWRERAVRVLLVVVAAELVITTRANRMNTSAVLLVGVGLMMLVRTMRWMPTPNGARGPAILLGLVAAAVMGFKAQLVPVVPVILAVSSVSSALAERKWRAWLAELGLVGGVALLALLVPAIDMVRTTGTISPVLWPGNYTVEARTFLDDVTAQQAWRNLVDRLQPGPWMPHALWAWALVPLLMRERGGRRMQVAILVGAALGVVVTVRAMSQSTASYTATYIWGFVLLVMTASVAWAGESRVPRVPPSWPVVVMLLLGAHRIYQQRSEIPERMHRLTERLAADPAGPHRRRDEDLVHAQQATPEGTRLLVMVPEVWAMDRHRNDVWTIDVPGFASPPPGFPYNQPPDAWLRYLRGLGVDYVVVDLDGSEPYSKQRAANWQREPDHTSRWLYEHVQRLRQGFQQLRDDGRAVHVQGSYAVFAVP